MDERPGDAQPLAHPPGVGAGPAVGGRAQPCAGEDVRHGAVEHGPVQAVESAEEVELFAPGHPPVGARILLQEPERAADGGVVG